MVRTNIRIQCAYLLHSFVVVFSYFRVATMASTNSNYYTNTFTVTSLRAKTTSTIIVRIQTSKRKAQVFYEDSLKTYFKMG